jgi:hypothetical protein
LSLKRGIDAPFVKLKQLAVSDVGVDLLKRSVQVGGLQLNGGALAVRRDARGELDVAGLMLPAPPAPAPAKPAAQRLPKLEGRLQADRPGCGGAHVCR